jgi:proline iminopeptidase
MGLTAWRLAPLVFVCAACSPGDGGRGGEDDAPDAAAAPAPRDTLLAVNGTNLFVHREGAGPAAIVVHGGPVLDHGYLRPYLAPLGRDLELVYYDQRLSGRSDGVVDSASVRLATFVDDLEGIRAALGLERVHLVAHSWGGLIALSYALAHPERVHSLVLVGPNPPSAALWQAEQRAEAAALTPEDTAGAGALRASAAFEAQEPAAVEAVLKHAFRSLFHDPERAEALRFHIEPDYAERSRQFGYVLPDLTSYDLLDELAGLAVPTLLVYGADEPGRRIGGDALVDALPHATRVIIERAGHFPFIEEPEAFLAAVRDFLAGIAQPLDDDDEPVEPPGS